MALDGLSVPMATLFSDTGELDLARNTRFARDLSEARVDHLFVLGSLGEFPLVSDDERSKLVEIVVESVTSGTDVWVGCGAPATRRAVAYAEAAEAAGAAAVVAVPPYYLHPPADAIDRYYRAIREAVSVPVFAYNIPSMVGYALDPERMHVLAQEEVLAGVKDTSGSQASVDAFLKGAPPGWVVMPGDDALAATSIAHGAAGAVMGLANFVPKLCLELVQSARAGDAARAQELQTLVTALVDVTHAAPFPAVDKFLAARLRGASVGYRAPYDALTADEETAVLSRLAPLEARLQPFLGR